MFALSTLKVEEVSGIDAISENDDIRIWNSGSSLYYAIKDAKLTLFNANGGIRFSNKFANPVILSYLERVSISL